MTDSIDHWELREKIIELCLWMNSSGLNQGTSGNISARYKKSMLITPSGIPYEQLKPTDICKMSLKHNRLEWSGPHKPSSEWHFHRAILQSNAEYGAVVHTHSTYATALSMAGTRIPACHYMIAAFGGHTVRCSKYATFGTPELSKNILKAMRNRSACLMSNHGMVVAGSDLDKAMWGAVELETLSKQYYLASSLNSIDILSKDEIRRVVAKFQNYGPKSKTQTTNIVGAQQVDPVQNNAQSASTSQPSATKKSPNIKLPVSKR